MSKGATPRHDPIPIGDVAKPPFARLADPAQLFRARARRFAAIAERHDLAPYLQLLGRVAEVQDEVQAGLPDPRMPAAEAIEQSRQFAMPALDRRHVLDDPALGTTMERVLSRLSEVPMPDAARAGHAAVVRADESERHAMAGGLLERTIPSAGLAAHLFVATALQVHLARMASRLDITRLVAVGETLCPACGSPPASSLVVGWPGAHGARFCACALCGTLWHVVRIKCVLCGSTGGIAYQQIEGSPGTIKAETCSSCQRFVKIMLQFKNPEIDPIADDVASVGLDMLVTETGYRRGGFNPFLVGY
jgi:FdhE protein